MQILRPHQVEYLGVLILTAEEVKAVEDGRKNLVIFDDKTCV